VSDSRNLKNYGCWRGIPQGKSDPPNCVEDITLLSVQSLLAVVGVGWFSMCTSVVWSLRVKRGSRELEVSVMSGEGPRARPQTRSRI
jgi:hypothetical protein